MTVGTFQELYRISKMELPDEDKSVLLVAALTGKSTDQVNDMPVVQFNKLCREVDQSFQLDAIGLDTSKPKQIIRVNGNLYKLNYELKRPPYNAGRYVEVATFSSDIITNLHRVLASMASPFKWNWRKCAWVPITLESWMHEQISEDMKQVDFKVAYHAAVFFYAVFNESMKDLQPYFLREMTGKMDQNRALQILQDSQQVMDGYTMPRWYRNLKT